jgi:hypothetical protein
MMLRDQLSRKSEAEVRIKQHEKQCNDEGQRLEDLLVHSRQTGPILGLKLDPGKQIES